MEDDGLLNDSFDAELENFLTGNGPPPNCSPSPVSIGAPADEETACLTGKPAASSTSATAAATAAAATAGAAASALAGGNYQQARDIVGDAAANAMGTMAAATLPASFQAMSVQPWRTFCLPLSVPSAALVFSRLTANLFYFQTNYAVLFVAALVLSIVLQPSALISVAITAIAWVLFMRKNQDPDWKLAVGGVELGRAHRWAAMTGGTAVVLLFMAGSTIFNAALTYLCFAALHGVLHDPSSCGPSSIHEDVPL